MFIIIIKRGFIQTHTSSHGAQTYHISLNNGPGVYFFPAIFTQATKQGRCLLVEDSHAVYNL